MPSPALQHRQAQLSSQQWRPLKLRSPRRHQPLLLLQVILTATICSQHQLNGYYPSPPTQQSSTYPLPQASIHPTGSPPSRLTPLLTAASKPHTALTSQVPPSPLSPSCILSNQISQLLHPLPGTLSITPSYLHLGHEWPTICHARQ